MLTERILIAISLTVGSDFVDAIDFAALLLSVAYDWRASCFDIASNVNDVIPFVVDGFASASQKLAGCVSKMIECKCPRRKKCIPVFRFG